MTEKLGNLGYPFDGHISRQAANWASEMREVRNKHAHQVEFSPAETYRALDSAELLLREVGATDEAQRIAARKPAVLSALSGGATGRPFPHRRVRHFWRTGRAAPRTTGGSPPFVDRDGGHHPASHRIGCSGDIAAYPPATARAARDGHV